MHYFCPAPQADFREWEGKECAGCILYSTTSSSPTSWSSWSWYLGCTDTWQLRLGCALVSFVISWVVTGRYWAGIPMRENYKDASELRWSQKAVRPLQGDGLEVTG